MRKQEDLVADTTLPSIEGVEKELNRVQYKVTYGKALRSTVYTLITVAAVAILIATLWLPVLKLYGSSMEPVLSEGEFVLSIKVNSFETGDNLSESLSQ